MDIFIYIGIIAGAVLLILLDYFIAEQFYKIANEKGYTDKCYFWYAFLLTGVGYAMVIALPDHSNYSAKTVVSDELPEL